MAEDTQYPYAAHPIRLAGWWLMLPAGLVLGWVAGHSPLDLEPWAEGILPQTEALVRLCLERLGIAFIGLIPLGLWLFRIIARHTISQQEPTASAVLDLGFISRNGPLLGLLGTVIALAAAGARLAVEVEADGNAAVLGVFPLVSQALLSTIAGIVLAIAADTTLHVFERKASPAKEKS
ncbi:MotA/TolQ/ExbB proton channel family protein [Ruficoccus sp. ZRK36]|uniref:MotA/TolQ/ExbB proton channel family protein n=1 Tax=Ruficoccus sp. ZRK36 TaxID=2866311 RepID=UPI001C73DAD0|nr:MotA/TolQ/ExbB proton channel family protein [Ruficoccus sp. ZRK36]QYY37311.1 MotA/TolQ/ExbB proton channel family protein [Ruficoccus sp. ZRK36]